MHNLKKLEGLQENLLEQNPEWNDENHFITYTSPLKKQLVTLDVVQRLSDISIHSAVGLNVWRIPLPEQHRSDIIEKSITLDLCEHCLTPVKRIMEDQETNGGYVNIMMHSLSLLLIHVLNSCSCGGYYYFIFISCRFSAQGLFDGVL